MSNSRFIRQIQLPGFGPEAQSALADSTIAVVGAGGLGSPVIAYLAASGIGKMILIDDDHVELSNLHRQVIHTESNIGTTKVDSATQTARALNSGIAIQTVCERLSWPNALTHLEGADAVIDGSDNFTTRHIVSAACVQLGLPHVWASILGFQAQMSVFWANHGPVYEDVYPTPPPPGAVPNCAENGVLGPLVGTIGSMMALEAVKLVTGVGTPLVGKIAYFDALDNTWEHIPVSGHPATVERLRANGPVVTPIATCDSVPQRCLDGELALVDVRERHEFESSFIPGAIHMPLSQLSDEADTPLPPAPAVVYCASGQRSLTAVSYTHLTLPTTCNLCRSRWSPYH